MLARFLRCSPSQIYALCGCALLQGGHREGDRRVLKGWIEEIESDVLGYLRGHQPVSLHDLASALRISEALALSYISILAREGKVFIGGLGIRGN